MAYKDKDTFFSEYLEKKKTENSFANSSSSGTKKTRDQFFLDYLKGKKESANTPDNRTSEERLSSALAEVHGREIPKGQSLASRLTNPSVRNATEEYLDGLKEKQSRLEEFIQSEKEEGERRAAINKKRKDAREAGELDSDKERESVLGYIGERVKLATDLVNESAEAFSRGEQESWAQTLKESANEFTNFFKNPSEMLDSSYKKSVTGEAKEEKDSVRYAPYEEMAQRGTSAKRMQEIEQNYPNLSKKAVVKGVGDVAASVTTMVPALIAGATPVVGPVLSAGIMAATSAPGAYEEARLDGATQEQAIKYSNVEAINQGIGDMMFGGIAGTGKGILDAGLDVLTRGASSRFAKRALGKLARSPLGKTAVKYLSSSAGEGVEEMAQSLISIANKRATYDPNAKVNWDDVKYEGIIGSLMGGVFGLTQIPANYMAYRGDADLVKTYAQSAAHITNAEEAKLVVSLGDEIVRQVDEAVKASDGNEELTERAQFIRDAVSSVRNEVVANAEAIAEENANISNAIESIAESPSEAIVEGSARLVETVAENIEPGEDAVKATIDIVRDKIQEQAELAAEAKTSEEKLAAQVDGAVLREIDSTLRNNKEEVETARGELPENNLTSLAESGTMEEQESAEQTEVILEYAKKKHTKTGEELDVVTIPARVDVDEYTRIKDQLKKIGGYYSKYQKGFVIPKESVDKIPGILDGIGIKLNGYPFAGSDATETTADTETNPKSAAKITYPEGLTSTDKTKFTRLFKKWIENEHVNISDMTSDDARKFASFASKLYQAGYNGTRRIGNFAGLTDEELTGFPVFLQDEFYNLGLEAGKKKNHAETSGTQEAKKVMDELGLGGGTIVDVNDSGEVVATEYSPDQDAGKLEKGENIPDSGIEMDRDEEDYSAKRQRVINEYANAVDNDLRKFIDNSIANKGLASDNFYLTTIDSDLAKQIKNAIGVDAEGFEVKIEPNRVQHIWINHGANGIENHSMANRDDIARMKYVLENPDSVVENDITKYKGTHRQPHPYLSGKSKGAKSVKIAKKVNGTYYIVEAVPDSDKHTAFIVTAYLNDSIKKTTSTADDAKASPARTAAGNDVNTLPDNSQTPAPISGRSENSIAYPGENVNAPESKIADYVVDRLEKGLKIKTEDIQKTANQAYGGTQAEGTYDVKSMTDAMELGVNRYLLDTIRENESEFNSDKATDAMDSIREINEDILAKIPTQTKRSDEQISLQQFSTPPNIAYTAAWVANIADSDSVLEPSAGIGGLATFAKAFGAETIVNELSERRLEVLKNLPFDGFYNENAEHIDNILPDNVKPTVVLMNPPFSSTGGRTKNSAKNAIPHIEQALLRLEDGGRLVAILGKGMANDTATFKGWWDELRKSYNIRANIGINGENYRKYGTTFDVQLVVIDKTGPQTSETIMGYYDNLEEIPALLEGVRNDRTRTGTADRGNESETALKGGRKTGKEVVSGRSQSDPGSGSDGVSGRSDSAPNGDLEVSDADRSGGSGEPGTGKSVQSEGDVRVPDDGGRGGRLAGRSDSGAGEERGSGRVDSRNGGAGASGQSGSLVPPESGISRTDLVKKSSATKKAAENDDGVYAEYKTAPLTVKNAKKHPAKLVESSAMSAVSSPVLTYTPHLDKKLIESGALSDAQLENISYAGQAHEQMLSNKQRKGYFIGDGTGVGKGRQLAGIIMDNWNQGRHKAIWISENKNLSEDARRDWKDLGGDPDQIIDWEKAQKKGIPSEGILFIPYSSLAGGKTKKRETTVLETLENWFGKDFDGVIVFDEAHNMGNLIPMKGARGTKKPSQKAVAGNNLQTELPNARITYASATGATNIENLSYAARLGLWGDGTSFRDVQDFVSKIGRSGIAAMELVARDMKSMGVYLARSISYDGVVYDSLQHKLTVDQRKMYDGMSEGWQIVLQNFDKAMKITGSENAKDVKQHRGQVYGNMQQFYNQVLTSMTMPTVIKDIEKQLASGKSCVIQLVNTNEAAQDRAVSDAKAEGKTDLDDLDITPRQLIVGYVENAFPVNQYEEYLDENGNKATRIVLDSSGKPVVNKQAVKIRDELIGRLNEISIPEGPLDMLLNHFGADQVAEITGRSGRVLTVKDENGNEHKQYVSRDSGKSNIAETKDFQDGNKRILVFSGAGSTGRSFHADKRAKNQQNRIHYVLQPGWKAETAVQGFGRTHRSNQVSAPVFRLVSTDVMGHKRFVTSIARRLDQLGALTKGQRQTGSGVFGEKDNLESPLSAQALREFYRRLGNNRLPGLDAKSVFGKMGLDKAFYDEFDRFTLNENIASDIPKFLNRLLALPVEEQNAVFNAFEDIRDSFYQAAIETGTLDMGLENVKADKIEIMQDDVVYTDPATGAETRYVKAKLFTKPRVIQTVEDAQGYRDGFKGLYRMQDGSVRAAYRLADKTDEFGRVKKYYALISPNVAVQSRYEEATMTIKTEAVPKDQWESSWTDEVKNVPEFNESERHMITGALLPIWNRLPETDNVKAQRIVASDGTQYLGRMINSDVIDMTLSQLDVNVQKTHYTGKQIYDVIMNRGKRVTMRGLYGGTLTFEKRRVSGENRLEVSGAGAYSLVDKYTGMIPETINFQKRYFIPTGKLGEEILEKAMKDLGGVRSIDSDESGAYYSLGSSRGKWGKGDEKAQVMSINELTRQAKRIFGVEINTGKIGEAGAAGIFKTHAGTIRTRQFGDIPTIAHELGHWFDKKYKLAQSPHIKTLVETYKDSLVNSGYSPSLFQYEAVAEYFSEFMRNQRATEKKFPKFTGWLYDTISEADQKRLLEYAGMTNSYFAADAERRADAQIHTRLKDDSFLAKAQLQLDVLLRNPRSYLGTLSRRFTRRFVDDLADLKSFGKSYDLAYFEKTADSVVSGRLFTAMTDKNGNVIGSSLRDILSNGNINDVNRLEFDKYLIARVALDRIEAAEKAKPEQKIGFVVYGDETLQNKDSIMERIEEYERKNETFHNTAEELYKYNRNLMQLAVDSGLVSKKLFEKLFEMYPHYVPLYRVMDDNNQSSGKVKRGYADQNSPIGRFKGSGRDIYSPVENIMQNVEKFTKACMRNDVMREFADYIDNNENLGWAGEKVPEASIFDVISTDGIARRLADFKSEKLSSMTAEQVNELLGEVMDFIGDYAGMWKPAAKQGRNVVSVMRNGSREYYEIHDVDLMKTLTALDPRETGAIMRLVGEVTKRFKVLTTGSNPLFGLTNVSRDIQSGFVSSVTVNDPIVYIKDYCLALWDAISQSEGYQDYVRNGGGWMGSLTMDYKQLKRFEKKLLRKKWGESGFIDKTKTFLSVLSEAIPRLVDAGESASRYAEFKRARAQGIETLEAIRKAQEVTVNFQRGGTFVKELDKLIPYFRASVNSMYHLFDVLSHGDKQQLQARWSKFVALNTIPAVIGILWREIAPWLFSEDEDEVEKAYDTLSTYNKNAYWCMYAGNGRFTRVAKPKDMTVFSTVWERLVEYSFYDNKSALYGLGEYVLDSVAPPTARDMTIIGTVLSLFENKTFTGAPIVPTAYQNLDRRLQYKGDTSLVAYSLGSALNLSPMQIDFVLEDTTGYVGTLITNLARVDGKTNLGFLNKWMVDSVYSTDNANIFYDQKELFERNAGSYKHTGGMDSRYTITDVYGKYKYAKIADTYSSLNKFMKSEKNADISRSMKDDMNGFLAAVNDMPINDLDKAVIDIAETTGVAVSDIAPYVVVPDEVTYSKNKFKEKYSLMFDEMMEYYVESQAALAVRYRDILASGYSDDMMAAAMKEAKEEIATQMRDRWEEIKFHEKYR